MKCVVAHNLTKLYKNTKAVDKIDLDLEAGEIFGLLGPNGAGKSTMIKLITTLIEPTSGSLEILGMDVTKDALAIRKKIGVILQQPSYEPNLTVEKALNKYGMMWNIPRKLRGQRVEDLLIEFDLTDIRKKRNEELSIGQRRRVQVAREFMHDMELLVLDEPTVGLDPAARRKLLNYIKAKARSGLSIFYTTHIMSEAEYLCDKIIVLDKGKVIAMDTSEDLKRKFDNRKKIEIRMPQNDYNLKSKLELFGDVKIKKDNSDHILTLYTSNTGKSLIDILKNLNESNMSIEDISIIPTSLEDIFLSIIEEKNASSD